MPTTSRLPDINVWLALTFDSHVHHPAAKLWFDGVADDQIMFCRLTQQGFLRLASNPKVVGSCALTLAGAWDAYDLFLSDSRISMVAEPPGLEPRWRSLARARTPSTKVWSDAFLAAFAIEGGHEFVTFDKGFRQYPGLSVTILP